MMILSKTFTSYDYPHSWNALLYISSQPAGGTVPLIPSVWPHTPSWPRRTRRLRPPPHWHPTGYKRLAGPEITADNWTNDDSWQLKTGPKMTAVFSAASCRLDQCGLDASFLAFTHHSWVFVGVCRDSDASCAGMLDIQAPLLSTLQCKWFQETMYTAEPWCMHTIHCIYSLGLYSLYSV